MFDIWQPRTTQQVQGIAEVAEVDAPRVTGITQLNSYYQSVLGAPGASVQHGPSNAVTVAGELNAYLGTAAGADMLGTRFPSSRAMLGHQVGNGDGDTVGSTDDVTLSGLLPASAPVRAQAQAGEWSALASWKVPGVSSTGSARDLMADRTVSGDLSRYAAAYQQGTVAPPSQALPPRVTSREVAAFMDYSDYSHSADPAAADGIRAEDAPARQVADLLGGFTRLPA